MTKQLVIGLFENGQANSSGRPNWRHPLDRRAHEFDRQPYWIDLARMCEDAGLHFLFLADAWGWAEVNGLRPAVALTEGLDLPRLDPFIIASAIVAHTRELGIVLTGSTLLEQPYSFARRFATLDELSDGRVGWNIVTTGTAATPASVEGGGILPVAATSESRTTCAAPKAATRVSRIRSAGIGWR